MKSNIKCRGIILARKNIGEADRLLTVFTDSLGKIQIIARGSRRIKSKLAPHIEPFCVTSLEFVEGKTFKILTSAERTVEGAEIKDLDNYRNISYLCEITNLTFHEAEPNKEIFDLLTQSIVRLATGDGAPICRYFELRLLGALGFRPELRICKKCGQPLPEQKCYIGDFEGLCCDGCRTQGPKVSKETLKVLRFMTERSLDDFLCIKDIAGLNSDLERIIAPYLAEVLPREPRSLKL